jgi:hypothetical protein
MCLAMAIHPVTAQEHREHGAHVHGVGRLNVAVEGNTLEIELDSPAMNLIGFEHEPHSKAEHAQRDNAIARLGRGEKLFVLPAAAACRLVSAEVTEEGEGHEHEAEAGHHHEEGEAGIHHSDINGHYRFHCDNPAQLNAIDVRLFEQFPATHELEVQFIGPRGQGAAELTADEHRLPF